MKTCLLAFFAVSFSSAQLVDQYAPPKAGCCLTNTAKALADQLQDWNQLGRYYADNQRLLQSPPDPGRVVFMGDSITDGWKLAQYFAGKPYVNRGISGQTTLQMIEDNLQAMTELAQAHGIKVILYSLTPVSDYTARKQTAARPPADILRLNAWIKDYAAKSNAIFADYYTATVDDSGALKNGFSGDGLHPNDKGYA